MSKSIKKEIIVGRKRLGATVLDDQEILKNFPFPHKITKILVQVAKFGICGIQFIYTDGSGNQVDGHCLLKPPDPKHYNLYEFIIPEDDYLLVVFGSCEENLCQIGFITYKGKQVQFGYDAEQKFAYCFMGNTFTCAKITFVKNFIFEVIFRLEKLPPNFLYTNLPELMKVIYPNHQLDPFGYVNVRPQYQQFEIQQW